MLGFITAQPPRRQRRHLLQPVERSDEPGGVATSTVTRRLSMISGFFAYLQARADVPTNPVPRGLQTRRERSRPRAGSALD